MATTRTATVTPRWLSRSSRTYPSIGNWVLAWMRDNLVHAEGDRFGSPFEPDPWFEDVIMRAYRFDPDTYERVTRRVVVGIAKGNAKTEYAAAWALAELVGPVVPHPGVLDGEWPTLRQSPNVPLGAASYEQAGFCFNAARTMVDRGALAPFCDTFEKEIRLKDRPGRLYRIAAEAGTVDGSLPTCFVADEVHEWQGRKERVHLVVGSSLSKRASGLEVNISTAGDPERSALLHQMYEAGVRVATGEVVDDTLLFLWYEAASDVDLSDPDLLRAAIREANPAVFQGVERIAKRFEVDRMPDHEFRRYHLNSWVSAGVSWLPAGVWDDMASNRVVLPGEKVVLGFDGSWNGDTTALVGCGEDGHLFEVGVWERPANAIDWRVPRSHVDQVVTDAFERWDVAELVCDPARWGMYIEEWAERFGAHHVLEYPNSRERMIPATAKFYDAAVNGLMSHDGSPTLARHVRSATMKEVRNGYVLQKDHPDRKIDAAIAAVMAYDSMMVRREPDRQPQVSFL
jgi:phage terminase large subunit-like protein